MLKMFMVSLVLAGFSAFPAPLGREGGYRPGGGECPGGIRPPETIMINFIFNRF